MVTDFMEMSLLIVLNKLYLKATSKKVNQSLINMILIMLFNLPRINFI